MSGGYIEAQVSSMHELRSECVSKPEVFLKRKISWGNNETRQPVTKTSDGDSERGQSHQSSESYQDVCHAVVLMITTVIRV